MRNAGEADCHQKSPDNVTMMVDKLVIHLQLIEEFSQDIDITNRMIAIIHGSTYLAQDTFKIF